ncbi:MAG: hypothetical protein ABH851_01950 [Methanobacteriota archaeon]
MGFLDWIFNKKDGAGAHSGGEVTLKKLDKWVVAEKKIQFKLVSSEVEKPLEEIKNRVNEIEKNIRIIRDKSGSCNVPDKFRKIIKTSKPKYVKNMQALLSKGFSRDIADFRELEEHSENLSNLLTELAKINLSEGRYLAIAYGKEMESIQLNGKLIQDEQEKIVEVLKSSDTLSKLGEIEEEFKDYSKLKKESLEEKNKASETKKRISLIEGKIKDIELELDKLSSGREAKEIEKHTKSLTEKENQIKSISDSVHSDFRHIERALKRYVKVCPENLQSVVKSLLDDPVDYFINGDLDKCAELLEKMQAAFESGSVDIKDSGKMSERIEQTRRGLDTNLKEKYLKLGEEIRLLNETISSSSLDEKLRRLSGEKTILLADLSSTRKELENHSGSSKKLNKEALKQFKDIKDTLDEEFKVTLKK